MQNLNEKFENLAAENAALKSFIDRCYVFDDPYTGNLSDYYTPADESPFMPKTPVTDAVIADIEARARKQGAYFVANRMLAAWDAGFIDDTAINAADIARMILTSTEFMEDAPAGDFDRSFADEILHGIAQQLRSGKGWHGRDSRN